TCAEKSRWTFHDHAAPCAQTRKVYYERIARCAMKYEEYQHLTFKRLEDGVLLITMNRPEVYNATNHRLHWELTQIWKDLHDDPETRVGLVTGAGKAFSAGGDLEMIDAMKGN